MRLVFKFLAFGLLCCSASFAQNKDSLGYRPLKQTIRQPAIPSNPSLPYHRYAPNSPEGIRATNARVQAEVREYNRTHARGRNQIIDSFLVAEGLAKRPQSSIHYNIAPPESPVSNRYFNALELLYQMGQSDSIDLTKAVWLSEAPYDTSIDYAAYHLQLDKLAAHVYSYGEQHALNTDDHVALNMLLFRFFTDTLGIYQPALEDSLYSYPASYDFQDYMGRQDMRKTFVDKLLRTGSGQCRSLPYLYLLLSERLGAKAQLAMAPNHSYIKFPDHYGQWHNVELTSGYLTSDQFIMYSGAVKAEAIKAGTYMRGLSDREVLAQIVTDLVSSYARLFGYDDFVLYCCRVAHELDPKNVTALMQYHNFLVSLLDKVVREYQEAGYTQATFEANPETQKLFRLLEQSEETLMQTGYAEMPPEQYQAWLQSIRQQAQQQAHQLKMQQLNQQIK